MLLKTSSAVPALRNESHSTAQQSTAQRSTAQHSTAQHSSLVPTYQVLRARPLGILLLELYGLVSVLL